MSDLIFRTLKTRTPSDNATPRIIIRLNLSIKMHLCSTFSKGSKVLLQKYQQQTWIQD